MEIARKLGKIENWKPKQWNLSINQAPVCKDLSVDISHISNYVWIKSYGFLLILFVMFPFVHKCCQRWCFVC